MHENKSEATSPPCGCCNSAHQYLQEGVHLLLHPVDKPPLDHQTVTEEKGKKKEILILDSGLMLRFYKNLLTLCIPFCSRWWPPCLSRWASGPPGTSEYEIKIDGIKTTILIKTQGSMIKMWLLSGWLQHHHLPKVVLVDTKPQVQLGGVVLQNPLEWVVIFTVLQGDNARQVKTWVARGEKKLMHRFLELQQFLWWFNEFKSYHRLHVFQGDLFSQHHLVERSDEKTYIKERKHDLPLASCV